MGNITTDIDLDGQDAPTVGSRTPNTRIYQDTAINVQAGGRLRGKDVTLAADSYSKSGDGEVDLETSEIYVRGTGTSNVGGTGPQSLVESKVIFSNDSSSPVYPLYRYQGGSATPLINRIVRVISEFPNDAANVSAGVYNVTGVAPGASVLDRLISEGSAFNIVPDVPNFDADNRAIGFRNVTGGAYYYRIGAPQLGTTRICFLSGDWSGLARPTHPVTAARALGIETFRSTNARNDATSPNGSAPADAMNYDIILIDFTTPASGVVPVASSSSNSAAQVGVHVVRTFIGLRPRLRDGLGTDRTATFSLAYTPPTDFNANTPFDSGTSSYDSNGGLLTIPSGAITASYEPIDNQFTSNNPIPLNGLWFQDYIELLDMNNLNVNARYNNIDSAANYILKAYSYLPDDGRYTIPLTRRATTLGKPSDFQDIPVTADRLIQGRTEAVARALTSVADGNELYAAFSISIKDTDQLVDRSTYFNNIVDDARGLGFISPLLLDLTGTSGTGLTFTNNVATAAVAQIDATFGVSAQENAINFFGSTSEIRLPAGTDNNRRYDAPVITMAARTFNSGSVTADTRISPTGAQTFNSTPVTTPRYDSTSHDVTLSSSPLISGDVDADDVVLSDGVIDSTTNTMTDPTGDVDVGSILSTGLTSRVRGRTVSIARPSEYTNGQLSSVTTLDTNGLTFTSGGTSNSGGAHRTSGPVVLGAGHAAIYNSLSGDQDITTTAANFRVETTTDMRDISHTAGTTNYDGNVDARDITLATAAAMNVNNGATVNARSFNGGNGTFAGTGPMNVTGTSDFGTATVSLTNDNWINRDGNTNSDITSGACNVSDIFVFQYRSTTSAGIGGRWRCRVWEAQSGTTTTNSAADIGASTSFNLDRAGGSGGRLVDRFASTINSPSINLGSGNSELTGTSLIGLTVSLTANSALTDAVINAASLATINGTPRFIRGRLLRGTTNVDGLDTTVTFTTDDAEGRTRAFQAITDRTAINIDGTAVARGATLRINNTPNVDTYVIVNNLQIEGTGAAPIIDKANPGRVFLLGTSVPRIGDSPNVAPGFTLGDDVFNEPAPVSTANTPEFIVAPTTVRFSGVGSRWQLYHLPAGSTSLPGALVRSSTSNAGDRVGGVLTYRASFPTTNVDGETVNVPTAIPTASTLFPGTELTNLNGATPGRYLLVSGNGTQSFLEEAVIPAVVETARYQYQSNATTDGQPTSPVVAIGFQGGVTPTITSATITHVTDPNAPTQATAVGTTTISSAGRIVWTGHSPAESTERRADNDILRAEFSQVRNQDNYLTRVATRLRTQLETDLVRQRTLPDIFGTTTPITFRYEPLAFGTDYVGVKGSTGTLATSHITLDGGATHEAAENLFLVFDDDSSSILNAVSARINGRDASADAIENVSTRDSDDNPTIETVNIESLSDQVITAINNVSGGPSGGGLSRSDEAKFRTAFNSLRNPIVPTASTFGTDAGFREDDT